MSSAVCQRRKKSAKSLTSKPPEKTYFQRFERSDSNRNKSLDSKRGVGSPDGVVLGHIAARLGVAIPLKRKMARMDERTQNRDSPPTRSSFLMTWKLISLKSCKSILISAAAEVPITITAQNLRV